MQDNNLNLVLVPDEDGDLSPQRDFSVNNVTADVSIFFKDIEAELLLFIEKYDYIVGCVAWLSNDVILKALADKLGVCIIVQKEDFIRSDYGQRSERKKKGIFQLYSNLPCFDAEDDLFPEGSMKFAARLDAVLCVGMKNVDHKPSFPRCHHKFIVGCTRASEYSGVLCPQEVWTGSFNFSRAATLSFENAVRIHDKECAAAYFQEFCQIASLAEPLDWADDKLNPYWRHHVEDNKVNFCIGCGSVGTTVFVDTLSKSEYWDGMHQHHFRTEGCILTDEPCSWVCTNCGVTDGYYEQFSTCFKCGVWCSKEEYGGLYVAEKGEYKMYCDFCGYNKTMAWEKHNTGSIRYLKLPYNLVSVSAYEKGHWKSLKSYSNEDFKKYYLDVAAYRPYVYTGDGKTYLTKFSYDGDDGYDDWYDAHTEDIEYDAFMEDLGEQVKLLEEKIKLEELREYMNSFCFVLESEIL